MAAIAAILARVRSARAKGKSCCMYRRGSRLFASGIRPQISCPGSPGPPVPVCAVPHVSSLPGPSVVLSGLSVIFVSALSGKSGKSTGKKASSCVKIYVNILCFWPSVGSPLPACVCVCVGVRLCVCACACSVRPRYVRRGKALKALYYP